MANLRKKGSRPVSRSKRTAPKRKKISAPRARITVKARDRLAGRRFARLVALQERLISPGGCPWDREQTHASLRKYLIEEAYEVLDAMESGDTAEFASELGDLLLQIIFHAVLAERAGGFSISDVVEAIYTKMVRRHPHVFGDAAAANSKEVLKKWEEIKAEERAAKRGSILPTPAAESVLAGLPRSLPATLEAFQLTRRASHIGFDWEDLRGIFEKIDEEKRELAELSPAAASGSASARVEEEVGDLLFAAVNVARFLGIDPEIALKKANRKFRSRFESMEAAAAAENRRLADVPRARMEELWNLAKQAEKPPASPSR